ncbi:glycosyltransferase family 4 protein [Halodesulfovibrio sp.]|jgi:glycosyltransferase involved in cell wall biosynthesis|uniref:glycosyltransferase family 4 protein n=1 Tax=Halodesulfovibrio sp. TaxID=1912772 RepID=UPI0025DB121C|nr:glycosyltransferase family 4 protein [Halodesulfovibrio sp.]MCT4535215.1 glycosyltransferase family 4 protein [Halodesulfovibrio sp.]
MRILHIGKYASPTFGGIERYLFELVQVQQEQGHDVCVFAAGEYDSSMTMPTRCLGALAGVPITPYMFRDLSRLIATFSPDVIHVHMPTLLALPLLQCRKGKIIVHWHSDVVIGESPLLFRMSYRLYRRYELWLLRNASAIIATSESYRQASLPLVSFAHKTQIIPLGVLLDTEQGKCGVEKKRMACELPSGTKTILCVGRHVPYKGFEDAIGALRFLPEEVTISFVGEGGLTEALQGLVKQYDLQHRVHFLGHVSDAVLQQQLHQADVLCVPSKNRHEAFGMVVLEAMRVGLPVLAADVQGSGLPELVRTNEIGELFPVGAQKTLAEKLMMLLGDDLLRQKYSSNGYRRIHHYDLRVLSNKIEKVYERFV